jgi:tetratricopeptide (TPR) repeat protein
LSNPDGRLIIGAALIGVAFLCSNSYQTTWQTNLGTISLSRFLTVVATHGGGGYWNECAIVDSRQPLAALNNSMADRYLRTALSTSPHNATLYRLLGQLEAARCDKQSAGSLLKTGWSISPDDPLLTFLVGWAYHDEGNTLSAIEQWKKAKGTERFFASLGNVCTVAECEAQAIHYYYLSDKIVPQPDIAREWMYLRACNILENSGHLVESKYWCQKRLLVHPGDFYALLGLGSIAFRQSQYAEAVTVLNEALQVQPDSDRAHALLGESYREQGLICAALAELGLARQLQPGTAWYEGSYAALAAQGRECNIR